MYTLEEALIHQSWTDQAEAVAAASRVPILPSAAEAPPGMAEGPTALAAAQEAIPPFLGGRPGPEESPRGWATEREIAARARDHIYT